MNSQYDSFNLRYEADFTVKLYKSVEWVPANILGKTRWSLNQIEKILLKLPEQRKKEIGCLYEALQLFHVSKFVINDEKQILEYENVIWEISKGGLDVVYGNKGMCAESAAWLIYFLKDTYEEIGFFTFIGTNMGGHIINYIKYKKYFYFVDMSLQATDLAASNAVEDGNLKGFLGNKNITCSILRAKSMEEFYTFYCLVHRRRMKEFFSFYYSADCAIPIGHMKEDNIILLPCGADITITVPNKKLDIIRWKYADIRQEGAIQ